MSQAQVVKRPNLILITLDTTRADHLSCYQPAKNKTGDHPVATPRLDELAKSGTLFLTAYSQTNQTNPSHVTIMSGVRAINHGVFNNLSPLPEGVDLLPLAFQRIGYRTAAFPATHHISTILKWRGFDDIYEVAPKSDAFLSTRVVTDRVIAWLEKHRRVDAANPFFLWVHCWDPHTPYQPPAGSATRFYSGDPKSGDTPELRNHPSIKKHKWLSDVTDPEYPQAMYRAEIHEMDRQIGRLLDYLDQTELRRSTGIVVVGDHGENLGEHDQFFNHYFIFEQTLRVPLIMRFHGYPPGLRVERKVCQLDIVPTIAKIYGLTLGHELQGLSLLRLLEGRPDPAITDRVVFVHEHGKNRQIAVRDHDYKIIYTIETTDRPPLLARRGDVWLFDLANDPGERHNLAADHPELVKKYRPFVRPWMALGLQRGDGAKPLTDPQRDHLRSLGYLDEQEDDIPSEGKKGPDGK